MLDGIGVGIRGVGTYLPPTIRTNDHWSAEWVGALAERSARDITASIDKTVAEGRATVDPTVAAATARYATDPFRGTQERRVVDPDMPASEMEVRAARAAIDAAGLTAQDIDCLMVYSSVSDRQQPKNHGLISSKLGLPSAAAAWAMDAGCASFMPQLVTAHRLVQTGEYNNVLCIVSSNTSLVTDFDAPSSVNVGDGAVAAVVGSVGPNHGYIASSFRTRGDLHGGICLAPKLDTDAPWYHTHLIDSPLVARVLDGQAVGVMATQAASLCVEVCDEVLAKAGYSIDDVAFFLSAQSTAWFSEAIAHALGVPDDKRTRLQDHFHKYAHLLAASAPMNMAVAMQLERLREGDLILIYSPGIGFTQAAILMRWTRTRHLGAA